MACRRHCLPPLQALVVTLLPGPPIAAAGPAPAGRAGLCRWQWRLLLRLLPPPPLLLLLLLLAHPQTAVMAPASWLHTALLPVWAAHPAGSGPEAPAAAGRLMPGPRVTPAAAAACCSGHHDCQRQSLLPLP
jgi:hypothetical protein